MARLILKRDNQKGKLGWLVSKDASHFYLAVQAKDWPKPVFRAFATCTPEFFEVCKALGQ